MARQQREQFGSSDKPAMLESAEIRDPVHGYVYATELERKIIDTLTFQRLRRIRQLAGAHLVYPGGQHSRFEHVIGCMYLAGRAGQMLRSKTAEVKVADCEKLRLAALLHDVGHGPFSHVFEEVIAEKTDLTHEDMTRKIIKETEIGDILSQYGFSKASMSDLAIGKSRTDPRFMNDVIGGGLSVDIMDYLLRDSYFTGVEYGKVDVHRIINSFEIVGEKLAIAQAALFAFEALMISRYEMFRAVYFHRTVRAAELMLIKSMALADKKLNLTDLSLENYLSLTDEVTLHRIVTMDAAGDKELNQARKLALDYLRRRLLKCVFEKTVQRRDSFFTSIFSRKSFRDDLSAQIAGLAKMNESDVFVDVPTAPSVPVSSAREAFNEIIVVGGKFRAKTDDARTRNSKNRRSPNAYALSLDQFPLIGRIAGYMDVLRVYTTEESRFRVQKAAESVFQSHGFETSVSM